MASSKGRGRRFTPEERARIRDRVGELLKKGWTERRIAAKLKIAKGLVGILKREMAEAAKAEGKKPIRISRIAEENWDLPRGCVHRFIITSAQDDTPVHEPFLQNLFAYAQHLGAYFMVGGYTYQLGLFEDHAVATAVYAEPLREYLRPTRVRMTDSLMWIGDANVLPTTANPLAGWTTANRGQHVIVPHARVAFESIPRMQSQPPRFAISTGTCTLPSYTPRAAGRKAIFHHTYAALLVEIDADGECFFRHLVASEDGSFQDLDAVVSNGRVETGYRVQAITWGDIHHEQLDPMIAAASFGCGPDGQPARRDSILDDLCPVYQFLHDSLDFRRRNHHDLSDPHQRAKIGFSTSGSVEDEVSAAAAFVNAVRRDWCRTVMVESNHDAALARWLKDSRGAEDWQNAAYWHEMNAAWHRAIQRGDDSFNVVEEAMRRAGLADDVEFVPSGGSYTVCGVECGLHGDLGVGGSRGSPNQYRRFGPKTTSGHTHTPKVVEGVYVAGVSAKLDQGYNRGPTTWAHAHVVLYSNGKRTLLCMSADGRYRAMADLAPTALAA